MLPDVDSQEAPVVGISHALQCKDEGSGTKDFSALPRSAQVKGCKSDGAASSKEPGFHGWGLS